MSIQCKISREEVEKILKDFAVRNHINDICELSSHDELAHLSIELKRLHNAMKVGYLIGYATFEDAIKYNIKFCVTDTSLTFYIDYCR